MKQVKRLENSMSPYNLRGASVQKIVISTIFLKFIKVFKSCTNNNFLEEEAKFRVLEKREHRYCVTNIGQ